MMSENGNNATYVSNHPNSVVAESFRLLQSNLEFFQAYNSAKTILVTSPAQGNGKTTIAVNLALSMAFSQNKVILVDADLTPTCCPCRTSNFKGSRAFGNYSK